MPTSETTITTLPSNDDSMFSASQLTVDKLWRIIKCCLIETSAITTTSANLMMSLYTIICFFVFVNCEIPLDNLYFLLTVVTSIIALAPGYIESNHGYRKALYKRFYPEFTLNHNPIVETSPLKRLFLWMVHSGPTTLSQMLSGGMFLNAIASTNVYSESPLIFKKEMRCVSDYFSSDIVGKYLAFSIGFVGAAVTVYPHTRWLTSRKIQKEGGIPLGENWAATLMAMNGLITTTWPMVQHLMDDIKAKRVGKISHISVEPIVFMICGVTLIFTRILLYLNTYMHERGANIRDKVARMSPFARRLFSLVYNEKSIFLSCAWSAWLFATALNDAGKFLNIPEETLYSVLVLMVSTQAFTKYIRYVAAAREVDVAQMPLLLNR